MEQMAYIINAKTNSAISTNSITLKLSKNEGK